MDANLTYAIATAVCALGQYFDCHTTDVSLAIKGFSEANSWAAKIQAKIGQAGFFVVKCMVIPAIGTLLFVRSGIGLSLAWLVPMAVYGWIAGIKNYLLLRKNNVKVF